MIWRHLLLQYPFRVLFRLSCVYRERFSELDGLAELSRKGALLDVARRVVVVVIEADFAPSHAAWMSHRVETAEDVRVVRLDRDWNSESGGVH